MSEAFPLAWPAGFPRTRERTLSMFKRQTFAQARDSLLEELDRLRANRIVLSTNVPLGRDGIPKGDPGRLKDPGVAVYFLWRGQDRVLACDRWIRIEDNMRALELSIDAMRGLERWGASDILNRVFTGFAALPAPEGDDWWIVLGVSATDPLEKIENAFRAKQRMAHPDMGGTHDQAVRLNHAIAAARRAKAKAS